MKRPLILIPAALLLCACPPAKSGAGKTGASKSAEAKEVAAKTLSKEEIAALRKQAKQLWGSIKHDPQVKPLEDPQVKLGQQLYFDARLSKSHKVSCNSCHQLDKWGVDGEATSPGHKGQRGTRNSPTVYNAFLHASQFWDGRRKTVEEQAGDPVLNPVEMAMPSKEAVVKVLSSIPGYVEGFKAAFPKSKEPLSYANMQAAIGAFERHLTTRAPFDEWIEGKDDALSQAALRGMDGFIKANCVMCHMSPLLGGQMMQKLGLVKPWPNQEDQGLYEHTKQLYDKMKFKVSALRDVAKTGPYFHDGKTKSLAEAVKLMAVHQLGKELSEAEVKDMVAFLESLTGTPTRPELTKAPELPKSGPNTPQPDES